jgi:hypothetical protein
LIGSIAGRRSRSVNTMTRQQWDFRCCVAPGAGFPTHPHRDWRSYLGVVWRAGVPRPPRQRLYDPSPARSEPGAAWPCVTGFAGASLASDPLIGFLARIRAIAQIRTKFAAPISSHTWGLSGPLIALRTRVTLRIETTPGRQKTTIKLIGRIRTEHLSELQAQLDAIGGSIVFDLDDVSLVNLDVVQFLSTCESQGIQLVNCPAFIRKWIDRERQGS